MKVIIIGGGQMGTYIARLLLEGKHTVKIIEHLDSVLEKLYGELPAGCVVAGSGTDPRLLESCGIADADAVAAVTGADETNLVASTIAKFEFNVPRVIARVNSPKNTWLFTREMGVDVGLNQADLLARLVVEEMDLRNTLTLLELGRGEYAIVQVTAEENAAAVGRPVRALGIPDGTLLIAIFRESGVVIPRGDTIIQTGDRVLAFGSREAHASVNAIFSEG